MDATEQVRLESIGTTPSGDLFWLEKRPQESGQVQGQGKSQLLPCAPVLPHFLSHALPHCGMHTRAFAWCVCLRVVARVRVYAFVCVTYAAYVCARAHVRV